MRILIILASGIGNSILFSPTLRELRKKYPLSEIDLYAYKESFAEPFKNSPLINNVYVQKDLRTLYRLRKNRYDICVTSFPSNKWQFNLFSYLTGAKIRATHSYKVGKLKTLSFLQNRKVLANENLHDVEQNLNLLSLLDVKMPLKKELLFHVDAKNNDFAIDFIKNNNLKGKYLIGIHPGSGPLEFKRDPEKKFVEKVEQIKNKNKFVLIFGGEEETEIKKKLKEMVENSIIVNENLKNTAALIKKCKHFVSNDTGLMHIAVAMGVPVTVFSKGTNLTRTSPFTKNAEIIILEENRLKYPFWDTKARIE